MATKKHKPLMIRRATSGRSNKLDDVQLNYNKMLEMRWKESRRKK